MKKDKLTKGKSMTKKQDISINKIEKNIIVLQEQAKETDNKISHLTLLMEEHSKSSEGFRDLVSKHCADINWLRWGVRILFGSGVVSIIVWLITTSMAK